MATRATSSYDIRNPPGHFCYHCGQALGGQVPAGTHVEDAHDNAESPDKENPAGYCEIKYFDCMKED